uniref:Dolichol-phosphate mannosyltransferase n=1 Tax=Coccidioides posadasii RMSCC 3488 TaxID=454284 RepID=A0A0J6FIA1_COCPO|nr:hypothetical protein CPAG_09206 [Coccidioides posadasii RMSCC 3488]
MDQQPTPSPRLGILHHYLDKLCAFEYGGSTPELKPHTLLFIAGLSDGLGTVPFINDIAKALEPTKWSVFSVLLSSSYSGWGMSTLDRDIEEIGSCVEYVRRYKGGRGHDKPGMIALMGHSTGSQDVLHYLYSPNPLQAGSGLKRHPVDGAILQAPVSDREYLLQTLGTGSATSEALTKVYNELVALAKANVAAGNMDTALPLAATAQLGYPHDVPLSSHRFLSITSPDSPESPLEDDLFSSDLNDDRLLQTFGAIGSRGMLKGSLLVLPGEEDEYVPMWVNKKMLLERWENATKQGAGGRDIWDTTSGLVAGAFNSPGGRTQEEPRKELVSRVERYLNKMEKL